MATSISQRWALGVIALLLTGTGCGQRPIDVSDAVDASPATDAIVATPSPDLAPGEAPPCSASGNCASGHACVQGLCVPRGMHCAEHLLPGLPSVDFVLSGGPDAPTSFPMPTSPLEVTCTSEGGHNVWGSMRVRGFSRDFVRVKVTLSDASGRRAGGGTQVVMTNSAGEYDGVFVYAGNDSGTVLDIRDLLGVPLTVDVTASDQCGRLATASLQAILAQRCTL